MGLRIAGLQPARRFGGCSRVPGFRFADYVGYTSAFAKDSRPVGPTVTSIGVGIGFARGSRPVGPAIRQESFSKMIVGSTQARVVITVIDPFRGFRAYAFVESKASFPARNVRSLPSWLNARDKGNSLSVR